MNSNPILSRRAVLAVGAAGAGAAALAACSSAGSTSATSMAPAGSVPAGGGASSPASSATTSITSGGGGGSALAKLDDITVGEAVSAKLPDGTAVLVSRPTETTAACFNAKCTHRGCTVAPAGRELHCPCHGSVYNATTGAVIHGPAPKALAPVAVRVVDGAVVPGGPTG